MYLTLSTREFAFIFNISKLGKSYKLKSLIEDIFVKEGSTKKVIGFRMSNDLYAFHLHF